MTRPSAQEAGPDARLLAALVQASGVEAFLVDADGMAARDVVARTPTASVLDRIHPRDRSAAAAQWAGGIARGEPFAIEWRLADAGDATRIGKFRAAPVGGSHEWIVTLADVTAVRRANAELYRTRDLARSVIAASRDGILAFGRDGRVLKWNAAFERVAGAAAKSLHGRAWHDCFAFADLPELRARVSAMLDDGQPFLHQESFDGTAMGMPRVLEFAFSPLHGPFGAMTGALCQVRDVTERLLLDGRVLQQAKVDSLGLLTTGIAHDFNNALAAMLGTAETIEMDLPPDSSAHAAVQDLVASTLRARDLVRQLLTFARQEPVRLAPLDARDVLAESLRLMRKLIPSTIDVQVHLPAAPVPVHADPVQLQQILINLCTNAEHAMRGQPTGTLEVSLATTEVDAALARTLPGLGTGAHAVLTVRDTGTGMSAEVVSHVCEPFFTTKPVGEGTGMGLAVVQQIATAHQGRLRIESALGVGTTMQVYLPLAAALPAASAAPVEVPRGQGRVLVVDDEPLLAQLLSEALRHYGFHAEAFPRPVDALTAFEAEPSAWAAVVTDQALPGMPGDCLAERLHAQRPDLPIVLLTGGAAAISPERAAVAGIAAVLAKPVRFRDLAQALLQAMRDTPTTTAARRSA